MTELGMILFTSSEGDGGRFATPDGDKFCHIMWVGFAT